MKNCPRCGSPNVIERAPKDGRKRWKCLSCGHKMIAKKKVQKNEIYLEQEKKEDVSNYELMFPKLSDDFSEFVSSLKSNPSKAKMIFKYACAILFVAVAVASYNVGKGVAIDEAWIMRKSDYQQIISEYTTASEKLPTLRKELASSSDLVKELNAYKKNRDERISEVSDLESQISDLTVDKENLEKQVSELSKEKENLTREIAEAKGKGYTLTAGLYVGGDDIPTGTYNINWISGSGNVFVGRQVNEIFGDNSRYGYIKTYKNCDVSYGTEIEISGNVKVQFKAKD